LGAWLIETHSGVNVKFMVKIGGEGIQMNKH